MVHWPNLAWEASREREGGLSLPTFVTNRDGLFAAKRGLTIWSDYFGSMEHGTTVPVEELLKSIPEVESVDDDILELAAIPTRLEVEDVFRHVPTKKAVGLDLLPSELFKAAPKEMAGLYYGLYLKCMLLTRTPVQWAGGILQEAYKQTKCPSKPESHRSLFLASQPPKLLQKYATTCSRSCIRSIADLRKELQ